MNDIPSEWLDWLTVFGYLGFTVLIIWRILESKHPSP